MYPGYNCLRKFTKCCCIPQRFIFAVMASLATFSAYTVRVSLNLAITEMALPPNETIDRSDPNEFCPIRDNDTYQSVKEHLYDWDEQTQGLILGSFYWGYIITHIPGALLGERIGGKHVLGSGMLLSALLNMVFPLAVKASDGYYVVPVVLRFTMGLGQGVVYPVLTTLVAQWVPPEEKTTISSVTFAGAILGTVLCNAVGGSLIKEAGNWEIIFYVFGALALLWNVAWQLFCYSKPQTHPCLKDPEREFLEEKLAADIQDTKGKTPWKAMVKSVPLWALFAVQFGHDWGWFAMVTYLPKYMKSVLRYNVQQNGLLSALPYVFMWVAIVASGWLGDLLINKKWLGIKPARIIFGTLGQAVSGLFMVLAAYVGCRNQLAVVLFTMSLFFMGFYFSGIKVNALDLSPNYAGTIMGIVNGLGVFAGIAVPITVGQIAQDQTMTQWRIVFWISFAWLAGTNLIFCFFMSAKVQPWNYPEKEN